MPVPTSYPISESKYLLLIKSTAQTKSGDGQISNWVITSQLYVILRNQHPQGILEGGKQTTFTRCFQLEKEEVC